jgi:hypothetical protein
MGQECFAHEKDISEDEGIGNGNPNFGIWPL